VVAVGAGDRAPAVGSGSGPLPLAGARGALVLTGLTKSYGGVEALRGVDLVAHAGEIHALIGENGAGKSTLVKILSGAIRPDGGEVYIDGEHQSLGTTALARDAGIATAYQELSLIPDWDVATNLLYLDRVVSRAGRIGPRTARRRTRKILEGVGITSIDPARKVRELRLAERQVLEIVHAMQADPRVLVLDEPTSALAPEQVEWFFARVRDFVARDRIVLFISHRMEEIASLCDRVTVLRDGRAVGTDAIAAMPEPRLVQLMLGSERERVLDQPHRIRSANASSAPVVVVVDELSSGHGLRDVSFQIRAGEIVGVAGLEGQGQSELFMALYGARRSSGSVTLDGRRLRLTSPATAMHQGVGLVPEDRGLALCLPLSIRANLTLGTFDMVARGGLVSPRREAALAARVMKRLKVRATSSSQPVEALSGGNQQKVLLARALSHQGRLVLLFEPTQGVDVGVKADIYAQLSDLASKGLGVLIYSSDEDELSLLCDRVLVLGKGKIVAELTSDNISRDAIVEAMVSYSDMESQPAAPAVPEAVTS
jgi:ribose transport system ATP-binding protein